MTFDELAADYDIVISTDDVMDNYYEVIETAFNWWEKHAYSTKLGVPFKPAKSVFQNAADAHALFAVFIRHKTSQQIVAAYVATFQQFIFNPDFSMASELFWYVEESERQKSLSGLLLTAVSAYLKKQNINLMTCSIAHLDSESSEITNKKIASLEKAGYNKTDTILYKRI